MAKKKNKPKRSKDKKSQERESNRKAITKTNEKNPKSVGKSNKLKYNDYLREKEIQEHKETSPVKNISVEEYLKMKEEEDKDNLS